MALTRPAMQSTAVTATMVLREKSDSCSLEVSPRPPIGMQHDQLLESCQKIRRKT